MSAWTIVHIRGVPIRAHISLLLAIHLALIIMAQFGALAALAGLHPSQLLLPAWAWGLLLSVGLFVCVALHEVGHTLLALARRRTVRSITLMLLGGISQIESEPGGQSAQTTAGAPDGLVAEPHEASIAVIGPVVSLALALIFYVAQRFASGVPDLKFGFFYMAQLNMTIAVFNLVPAFPMDGGRVLRALIARKWGYERGTSIAVWVSKFFALTFAVIGLISPNLVLLLIALFVYTSGVYEMRILAIRRLMTGLTAEEIMRAPPLAVSAAAPVEEVLRVLLTREQALVPVVYQRGGDSTRRILGIAEIDTLERVPEERRQSVPVGMATNHDVLLLRRGDPAMRAVDAILGQAPVAAVVDQEGVLEGWIDEEAIAHSIRRRAGGRGDQDRSRRAA